MMANLNKVFLIGNLTRDPELRYTPSAKPVCELSVAVNEKYKDKETTYYAGVTTWGNTAEFCAEYLTKGSLVYVEGKLTRDEWEDKKTGEKRNKTKITALNVQLLGGGHPKQERTQSSKPKPQENFDDDEFCSVDGDEVPF